jgi:hypothetical protein
MAGFRRMLRQPAENLSWQPAASTDIQPHDEFEANVQRSASFIAPRFYCTETICAPCGVVIAWTKFAKSESPTKIINFLESVYPSESSRPDYVCVDKACLILRTSLNNGSWEKWRNTSRFIVDSYHYSNHRKTDQLCRKWCNPAPLDGSAPNLVVVEHNNAGKPHYKRAFNTQACEQLNAWIGGFESILRKMTQGNFNWFLHTMLFYHTRLVIQKQAERAAKEHADGGSDDNDANSDTSDD